MINSKINKKKKKINFKTLVKTLSKFRISVSPFVLGTKGAAIFFSNKAAQSNPAKNSCFRMPVASSLAVGSRSNKREMNALAWGETSFLKDFNKWLIWMMEKEEMVKKMKYLSCCSLKVSGEGEIKIYLFSYRLWRKF